MLAFVQDFSPASSSVTAKSGFGIGLYKPLPSHVKCQIGDTADILKEISPF